MATSFSVMTILPRWTIPPELPLQPGSRDPLGFQRYAARFADNILPNITVLTTRARYYAFLAWMLDEIALAIEPRFLVGDALPFEEYTETVARFERFLALAEAVWHSNQENGCSWVGKRRSKALVRGGRRSLPLHISLTVREGVQGTLANYRLSMKAIGLLSEIQGPLPDLLTDEGRELADKFRRAVRKAKAKRASSLCLDLNQLSVRMSVLEDIGKWMCLSAISDAEYTLLGPKLLGGEHEVLVNELRNTFEHKLASTDESEILKSYLRSDARQGVAFELKQIAVYQTFALACLGLFKGLRVAFEEIGQERRLDEILAAQLEYEGIQPSSTLGTLTRQVEGLEEIVSLHNQPGDWLKESAEWIRPALRLLAWLARRVEAEPALVFSETVDSVSLQDVADLMRLTDRQVDKVLEMLCERLASDHQRVFISKRKKPWLSLSGPYLRLEDDVDLPLYFPPNSVRLGSLISIFRDLEMRHGQAGS
jgi:hypothetical protein